MKERIAIFIAAITVWPVFAKSEMLHHTVRFTAAQSAAVGPVEKLVVTVDCGWIESLGRIPELYNIKMGYDTPVVNVLEARPPLAAAAVSLDKWSGVITATGRERECFGVKVHAEGRKSEIDLDTPNKQK